MLESVSDTGDKGTNKTQALQKESQQGQTFLMGKGGGELPQTLCGAEEGGLGPVIAVQGSDPAGNIQMGMSEWSPQATRTPREATVTAAVARHKATNLVNFSPFFFFCNSIAWFSSMKPANTIYVTTTEVWINLQGVESHFPHRMLRAFS